MINKITHIVVTRLALKWRYNETNLTWDEWLQNSIYLMDKFCRPSLKNQKNQNFYLLSLVDESINDFGNKLENEDIIKIDSNGVENINERIIEGINCYINKLIDSDGIILTRLDRDDCLRNDFIDNVKKHLISGEEKYVDLNHSITYDLNNNTFHDSKKYYKTFVSPFVSVYEKINDGKIRCVPFMVDHTKISKILYGEKVDDLYAMQVIHKYNLKNKVFGDKISINKRDYGIN